MTTAGKIRLLLTLLSVSLFCTAVIVQKTFTPARNLNQTAETLQTNLHKQEAHLNEYLNDAPKFNSLKTLENKPKFALKFISEFSKTNNIWLITLKKGHVAFWSGAKVIPANIDKIKAGYSFTKEDNGYYEIVRKDVGDFSAIFFVLVKREYSFTNQYLINFFSQNLLKDNNLEIADFTDKNIYPIHNANGQYLFSVKLKQGELNHSFFYSEVTLWLLTLLAMCVLMHNVCNYIAAKWNTGLSLFLLAIFIIAIRFVNLYYGWPEFTYSIKVFNPEFYASSYVFPSLGDLCVNVLFITWFAVFFYGKRSQLIKKRPGNAAGYVIFFTGLFTLIVVSTALLRLFYGLVINSKISFDVSNVLNLSTLSMLGVLMLCFSFLIFYLLSEVFLTVTEELKISDSFKITWFAIGLVIATAIFAYVWTFSLFYVLWGLIVLIRAVAYRYHSGRLDSASFAAIILICATIASLKLNYFQNIKERETSKAYIQKLEVPDDAYSNEIFRKIEYQIINDTSIIHYFKDSLHNSNYLKTRIQKLYLNGYLSKYDFNVHVFNAADKPVFTDKNYALNVFKSMVLYSSFKVSNYFYRENESFGFQNYFAILPVNDREQSLGTLVIELKSKPLQAFSSFPGLLVDGQINTENEFKGYSYAFYIDGKLLSQSGNYVYNLANTDLHGTLKKYIYKTTRDTGNAWYLNFTTYKHLIYMPSMRNLIVVSRGNNLVFFGITSVTFFFVVFLVFGGFVVLIRWLWIKLRILNITRSGIKWKFKPNFELVLYKTRIQFSLIFTVVITLGLVGFITFYSISTQFQTQQDRSIRDRITRIAAAFEAGPYLNFLGGNKEENQVAFNEFANAYSSDLTLYDVNGIEQASTEPKIYEFGLLARRINGSAYAYLNGLKYSEYVSDEKIGNFSYKAAYVPIRNAKNVPVAYLQLPYFSNETDYRERIGSLLNIMINVYALVFIGIGLFAVIIARQITAPLSFIQHSLSKTIYGKKNEPIQWNRNDEIGALVKEYNKMISDLESSAQRLAQSERESAWREMAKQVAHEIKNPLTPLKLGLQLLDKSWKDKDPKFDQKFERFSKSFVEQIESLSSIASEFSAFAKMPDTRLEHLNLFDILLQAITIFKHMDNVKIAYQQPDTAFVINADKDQLLRCFNNLLKNAIEATPADKACLIEINHLITSKNILLTIKDNGAGIPEELREKIFEPNFTTKSSGTGLGLAFVKNSIENAGGKVWFETIVGEGTTFYFSLPAV